MSTQDDVSRTLRERADDIESARPLTFDDVRGRARRIRRRRAGGVAAGVALVAAIAVPVALLGGAGADRSDPDPATPSPSRAVDRSAGLPTLQDGVIIYPDGPRIPLQLDDGAVADGFAPLGNFFAVTVQEKSGDHVVNVYDTQGNLLHRKKGTGPLVVRERGNLGDAVAWSAADGSVQLLSPEKGGVVFLGKVEGDDATAAAIVGACPACQVLVRVHDGSDLGRTWAVGHDETEPPAAVPAIVDASADGRLIAGLDQVADDGIHLCGGVYDRWVADDFLWHQCEDNVFSFSPDDSLVMTTFAEGLGPTGLKLRDSHTGATVAELTGASLITSYAWEDATHLLAVVVADDGSTSVERIGTAGTETVLDGFHTDDPTLGVPVILPSQ